VSLLTRRLGSTRGMRPPSRSRRWISPAVDPSRRESGWGGRGSRARCCLSQRRWIGI